MNRGDPGSAGIFSTYPAAYLSTLGGFGDQVGTRNTRADVDTPAGMSVDNESVNAR
jgi:hypothetical protein